MRAIVQREYGVIGASGGVGTFAVQLANHLYRSIFHSSWA
jgi:NADPH:quinone reductase-like Zn-dependent oxidoreductase